MGEWVNGGVNEWRDGWVGGGPLDGWVNGWVNGGSMDGCVTRWMDVRGWRSMIFTSRARVFGCLSDWVDGRPRMAVYDLHLSGSCLWLPEWLGGWTSEDGGLWSSPLWLVSLVAWVTGWMDVRGWLSMIFTSVTRVFGCLSDWVDGRPRMAVYDLHLSGSCLWLPEWLGGWTSEDGCLWSSPLGLVSLVASVTGWMDVRGWLSMIFTSRARVFGCLSDWVDGRPRMAVYDLHLCDSCLWLPEWLGGWTSEDGCLWSSPLWLVSLVAWVTGWMDVRGWLSMIFTSRARVFGCLSDWVDGRPRMAVYDLHLSGSCLWLPEWLGGWTSEDGCLWSSPLGLVSLVAWVTGWMDVRGWRSMIFTSRARVFGCLSDWVDGRPRMAVYDLHLCDSCLWLPEWLGGWTSEDGCLWSSPLGLVSLVAWVTGWMDVRGWLSMIFTSVTRVFGCLSDWVDGRPRMAVYDLHLSGSCLWLPEWLGGWTSEDGCLWSSPLWLVSLVAWVTGWMDVRGWLSMIFTSRARVFGCLSDWVDGRPRMAVYDLHLCDSCLWLPEWLGGWTSEDGCLWSSPLGLVSLVAWVTGWMDVRGWRSMIFTSRARVFGCLSDWVDGRPRMAVYDLHLSGSCLWLPEWLGGWTSEDGGLWSSPLWLVSLVAWVTGWMDVRGWRSMIFTSRARVFGCLSDWVDGRPRMAVYDLHLSGSCLWLPEWLGGWTSEDGCLWSSPLGLVSLFAWVTGWMDVRGWRSMIFTSRARVSGWPSDWVDGRPRMAVYDLHLSGSCLWLPEWLGGWTSEDGGLWSSPLWLVSLVAWVTGWMDVRGWRSMIFTSVTRVFGCLSDWVDGRPRMAVYDLHLSGSCLWLPEWLGGWTSEDGCLWSSPLWLVSLVAWVTGWMDVRGWRSMIFTSRARVFGCLSDWVDGRPRMAVYDLHLCDSCLWLPEHVTHCLSVLWAEHSHPRPGWLSSDVQYWMIIFIFSMRKEMYLKMVTFMLCEVYYFDRAAQTTLMLSLKLCLCSIESMIVLF